MPAHPPPTPPSPTGGGEVLKNSSTTTDTPGGTEFTWKLSKFSRVGARSSGVGAWFSRVGAESSKVGAQFSRVGARLSTAGARSSRVGARPSGRAFHQIGTQLPAFFVRFQSFTLLGRFSGVVH